MKNSGDFDKSEDLRLFQDIISEIKNNQSLKKESSDSVDNDRRTSKSKNQLVTKEARENKVEDYVKSEISLEDINKDIRIAILENNENFKKEINEHLNKFRTELEGKINSAKQETKEEIKTLKSDAIKVAGLIITVLCTVLGLVAWLIVPDINNIKSIPVHKEKIEQLEKNFDKLFASKKC